MKSAGFGGLVKVLAEVLDQPEKYTEEGVEVARTWYRARFFSQSKLFLSALKAKSDLIVIPFEFYMFGGILNTLQFLLFLPFFKIFGKKIVLIMHQVLDKDLSPFLGNKTVGNLLGLFVPLLNFYLKSFSTGVVVFEQVLKNRLGGNKNIQVIPHAVLQENAKDCMTAKAALGLDDGKKYVLYFGFLSPYKGVDLLMNSWSNNFGYTLIIAGGGNPNHMKKPSYRLFIDNLENLAKEKSIIMPGFIPQEKMIDYFSAADFVVFPYRTFMSSSGPLTQAFSYKKGVLLSNELKDYFESLDMSQALSESGIEASAICFDTRSSLKEKLQWASENKSKLELFSEKMRSVRSWSNVALSYINYFSGLTKQND